MAMTDVLIEEIVDDVKHIGEVLDVPHVIQMNIDFIETYIDRAPIATALVLGDMLLLYQELKAKAENVG